MKNGEMVKTGIYQITIFNKRYIGSTESSFNNRFRTHLYELKNNKHHSQYMQNTYNKYGLENLKFEILEIINDKSKIKEREQYYLDMLNPELNISKSSDCPMRGRKHSEETKKKFKGRPAWNKGILRTEQEKNNMVEGRKAKNKLRPKEYWEWRSEIGKKYATRHFLGKQHSKKTKELLRKNYTEKENHIICIETQEIFECQIDAAKKYNIKQDHISEHLNGKRNSIGDYTFKYLNKETKKYKESRLVKIIDHNNRIFKKMIDAIKYYNLNENKVRNTFKSKGYFQNNEIILRRYNE